MTGGLMAAEGSRCAELIEWLGTLPLDGNDRLISTPRFFAHDEGDYDTQYKIAPIYRPSGHGLVTMLREMNADFDGPALEVGCGTGYTSVGLVESGAYPLVVLTDPSPTFLRITAEKVGRVSVPGMPPIYAVLDGDELHRLPESTSSLIMLRSVLHHVIDVDSFISSAARALAPGGRLVCYEPCQDGLMMMGAIAKFIPSTLRAAGVEVTAEYQHWLDLLVATMRFYCRRDIDKSAGEDKHLFRVDEVMRTGRAVGLDFDFVPNVDFEHFAPAPKDRGTVQPFGSFFGMYVEHCMRFPKDLVRAIETHVLPLCEFLDDLGTRGASIYNHGIFIGLKR